jgi:hypothetical protein
MYSCFKSFRNFIENTQIKCPKNKENLTNLCILFGLNELQNNAVGCYESGYFSSGINDNLRHAINIMMERIRPQMVSLSEIYGVPDNVLLSAIGNSYGDIYET